MLSQDCPAAFDAMVVASMCCKKRREFLQLHKPSTMTSLAPAKFRLDLMQLLPRVSRNIKTARLFAAAAFHDGSVAVWSVESGTLERPSWAWVSHSSDENSFGSTKCSNRKSWVLDEVFPFSFQLCS